MTHERDTDDLDAHQVEAIIQHGRRLREQQHKASVGTDDNAMVKALHAALARVDRDWRRKTERCEVRVFEC